MNDLLPFPLPVVPKWQIFDVGKLVQEVCLSLASQLAAHGIEIQIDVPPGTLASADCDLLRRALVNLVHNATRAMPKGGELTITAWQSERGLELEVADSGPGIDRRSRKRSYESSIRNHRADQSGLPVVDRIAQSHGGDVTVANCPQGGAAFTMRIPQRGLNKVA